MVTPQVQTAVSSHRTLSDQSLSRYERLLAIGLGVALALVAALALMTPSAALQASADSAAVAAVQTAAHGKAIPRTAVSPAAGGDSTSVE